MLCVTVSVSLESPSLATPLALVSQGFPEAGLPLGQPPAHLVQPASAGHSSLFLLFPAFGIHYVWFHTYEFPRAPF